MEKENNLEEEEEEEEAIELVLFQVSECYVYLKGSLLQTLNFDNKHKTYHRGRRLAVLRRAKDSITLTRQMADEWNVNKWAWEGTLKVISKGEECIIRLEDKKTGELYARAFLRDGEPHPVEPVIDSSRYFVLRVEENIDGRLRHAFIGIGFQERPEAYDFQAALHDHMKYLNKKKTAEEMEQQHLNTSSVDYSLKDGETLVLQLKNKGSGNIKSKFFEQGLNNLSLDDNGTKKESAIGIKLPPSLSAPLSPAATSQNSPSGSPTKFSLNETSEDESSNPEKEQPKKSGFHESQDLQDIPDDDFGDFQAAG